MGKDAMRIAATSLCALALACAASKPAAQAQPRARAPVPLDEYFKVRRHLTFFSRGLRFSHDEKLAVFQSDAGGRLDLWVKPLDGGPAKQVTDFKDSLISGFAWSRDGKTLACTRGLSLRDAVLISETK